MNRIQKLVGIALLVVLVSVIASFSLVEFGSALIASVGWHDEQMASVGWHDEQMASVGWHDEQMASVGWHDEQMASVDLFFPLG